MNLKKKIIYSSLIGLVLVFYILFFTIFDLKHISSVTNAEGFYYQLSHPQTYVGDVVPNAYIYLIFKLLHGVFILGAFLYVFFFKKNSNVWLVLLQISLLFLLNLVTYYAGLDLANGSDTTVWIYASLGYVGFLALVVALEFLQIYSLSIKQGLKKLFGKIGAGIKKLLSVFKKKDKKEISE